MKHSKYKEDATINASEMAISRKKALNVLQTRNLKKALALFEKAKAAGCSKSAGYLEILNKKKDFWIDVILAAENMNLTCSNKDKTRVPISAANSKRI